MRLYVTMKSRHIKIAEHLHNWARFSLIILTFLLAPFFFPDPVVALPVTKAILIVVLTFISFLCWIVSALLQKKMEIARSALLIALIGVFATYIIAALLSTNPYLSFLGAGIEIDTVLTIFVGITLVLLTSSIFRTRKDILMMLSVLLLSAAVTVIIHIIDGLDIFSAILIPKMGLETLIGGLNDGGIFFALIAILCTAALSFLSQKGFVRIFSSVLLILSLIFIAAANFPLIWYALFLSALILFSLLYAEQSGKIHMTQIWSIVLVTLVSFVFIVGGSPIREIVPNAFGLDHVSSVPSWTETIEIMESSLRRQPLTGSGPNRFNTSWQLYKPASSHSSLLWSTDVDAGAGFIPSSVVTVGLIGGIFWVLFYVVLFYLVVRSFFTRSKIKRFLIHSLGIATVFLWIFSLLYVPSLTLFILTFILTGLFISAERLDNKNNVTISLTTRTTTGFGTTVLSILLIIITLSLFPVYLNTFRAAIAYREGLIAFEQRGDISAAEMYTQKAAEIQPADRYHRTLARIQIERMNSIIAQDTEDVESFRNVLDEAITFARTATEFDPHNYKNWLTLGDVFEAAVPVGVVGTYEMARDAYTNGLNTAPSHPLILMSIGRLEYRVGNTEEALTAIEKALRVRPQYLQALLLLAQIEKDSGNIGQALQAARTAFNIYPGDITLGFFLGELLYTEGLYEEAIPVLRSVLMEEPTYADAKYYLGLSYYRLERLNDALAQFEDIRTLNPGNEVVERMIDNMRAGEEPFGD